MTIEEQIEVTLKEAAKGAPAETTPSQRLWQMAFNEYLRAVVTYARSAGYWSSKYNAIPGNTQSERKRAERTIAHNKHIEVTKLLNEAEYDLQEWVKCHRYPEG